ncbi:hypothetical protein [uncultured Shewanella sp.]|uniref:hypothetical protein n=1 Tax=uncultured Shewanella sp. TaxID=173975 RepID=UPI002610F924|nr:hypothetical protein [uncultured Shewanella sp.]
MQAEVSKVLSYWQVAMQYLDLSIIVTILYDAILAALSSTILEVTHYYRFIMYLKK